MKIDSKDISVIVQGHVKGTRDDPDEERWTYQSLSSVRKHLPDAELILSTFKECDVEGLPFDILVKSDDPGFLDLGEVNRLVGNTNRQIVSTLAGLKKAGRKYALKMRYDLVLDGSHFLNYHDDFPARIEEWKFLKKRIISCTSVSFNPRKKFVVPFAPSDWFHFGLTEDVTSLWDIPVIPEPDEKKDPDNPNGTKKEYRDIHRYAAEQYIWISFLRKFVEINCRYSNDLFDGSLDKTDMSIVNNIILLEPEQIPLTCIKYRDKNFLTYSKSINYTHSEWLDLYEKFYLKKYFPVHPAGSSPRFSPVITENQTPQPPDEPLIQVLQKTFKKIPGIDFRRLENRLQEKDINRINRFPGENFKLQAAVVKQLKPKLIFEFGMGRGLNALCMKQYMKEHAYIVSVNMNDYHWKGSENCVLRDVDFTFGSMTEKKIDLSLPDNLADVLPSALEADMLVFKIEDGLLLNKILVALLNAELKREVFWVVHHIRLWSIAPIWRNIQMPKMDLTSLGHSKGIGMVHKKRDML